MSHDSQNQLSRAYTEYAELSVYDLFKEYIGSPVFPVLGNHDSNPEAIDAPHSLPGPLGQQFSWNYDHVASLWQHNGWIDSTTANEARLHYGAYSVLNQYGLRIITLNTDFWYRSNYCKLLCWCHFLFIPDLASKLYQHLEPGCLWHAWISDPGVASCGRL